MIVASSDARQQVQPGFVARRHPRHIAATRHSPPREIASVEKKSGLVSYKLHQHSSSPAATGGVVACAAGGAAVRTAASRTLGIALP